MSSYFALTESLMSLVMNPQTGPWFRSLASLWTRQL